MPNEEQERLKRIREKQLQARDPLVKQRKFQSSSVIKEKRMRKKFSLSKAWKEIPHIIRTPFYGLILGVVILVVLPMFWDSPYTFIAGAAATIILILFGVVLGNSLDLRDSIRNDIN